MIHSSALEIVADLQRLVLLPENLQVRETDDAAIELKLVSKEQMIDAVETLHNPELVSEDAWASLSKSTQVWATKSFESSEPLSILGFDIYKIELDLSYVEEQDVVSLEVVSDEDTSEFFTGIVTTLKIDPAGHVSLIVIETPDRKVMSFPAQAIRAAKFIHVDDLKKIASIEDSIVSVAPLRVKEVDPSVLPEFVQGVLNPEKISASTDTEPLSMQSQIKATNAASKMKSDAIVALTRDEQEELAVVRAAHPIVKAPIVKAPAKPPRKEALLDQTTSNREIRRFVCMHPSCTLQDLRNYCVENKLKFTESTLPVLQSDVKQTLAVYHEVQEKMRQTIDEESK